MAVARVETGPGDEPTAEADDFEQLYRRCWTDLVALCRRALGRGADAEDAAQEAFLRAWLARDQYSPTQPYWPWLATIAYRLCVDWQRRLARQAATAEASEPDVVEVTPERAAVAAEELRIVIEALGDLRHRDRWALLLRELGGWSYQRIAEVQGVTVDAVRSSLKRARASLRRSVLHDDVFGSMPGDVSAVAIHADDRGRPTIARLPSEQFPSA